MMNNNAIALVLTAAVATLGAKVAHAAWGTAIAIPQGSHATVTYPPRGVVGTLLTSSLNTTLEFTQANAPFQAWHAWICQDGYANGGTYNGVVSHSARSNQWCPPDKVPLMSGWGNAGDP